MEMKLLSLKKYTSPYDATENKNYEDFIIFYELNNI